MNPAQMQKMMKQMGMEMEEIGASEVIIKCDGYQLRFRKPQVVLANIMGRSVYQVSGDEIREETASTEEDVKMVMEQTGADKETVEKTLKDLNNDLAKAIMELKKK